MPQEGQSEQPSMEEILASIRRIIAEDAGGPPAAAVPPRPPQPVPPPAAPAAEPEILELTEKIEEDGTVVSISAAGARRPAMGLVADRKAAAETLRPIPERAPAVAPLPEPPSKPMPPPLVTVPPAPKPVAVPPAPPPVPASLIETPPPSRSSPVAEAAPPKAAPGVPTVDTAPPPRTAAEPPRAATLTFADEPLVSGVTAAASVAALSQLADLGQHGRIGNLLLENGRTLESLVRELLRPILQNWLDINLASLVERLVREEIQRMTREAQTR
jgi:uncharacterized protein